MTRSGGRWFSRVTGYTAVINQNSSGHSAAYPIPPQIRQLSSSMQGSEDRIVRPPTNSACGQGACRANALTKSGACNDRFGEVIGQVGQLYLVR
jgi:hypothetical protein